MNQEREVDPVAGELFLAGERVPPGIYMLVGGHRTVCLETEDVLPATLDGKVACYHTVTHAVVTQRQPAYMPTEAIGFNVLPTLTLQDDPATIHERVQGA